MSRCTQWMTKAMFNFFCSCFLSCQYIVYLMVAHGKHHGRAWQFQFIQKKIRFKWWLRPSRIKKEKIKKTRHEIESKEEPYWRLWFCSHKPLHCTATHCIAYVPKLSMKKRCKKCSLNSWPNTMRKKKSKTYLQIVKSRVTSSLLWLLDCFDFGFWISSFVYQSSKIKQPISQW